MRSGFAIRNEITLHVALWWWQKNRMLVVAMKVSEGTKRRSWQAGRYTPLPGVICSCPRHSMLGFPFAASGFVVLVTCWRGIEYVSVWLECSGTSRHPRASAKRLSIKDSVLPVLLYVVSFLDRFSLPTRSFLFGYISVFVSLTSSLDYVHYVCLASWCPP